MWADSRGHPATKYRHIQAALSVQMGDVTAAVASSVRGPPALSPERPPILPPLQPSGDAVAALRAALGAQASEQTQPALEQAAPPLTPPQVQAGRTFGGPAWGATEVSTGRQSVSNSPAATRLVLLQPRLRLLSWNDTVYQHRISTLQVNQPLSNPRYSRHISAGLSPRTALTLNYCLPHREEGTSWAGCASLCDTLRRTQSLSRAQPQWNQKSSAMASTVWLRFAQQCFQHCSRQHGGRMWCCYRPGCLILSLSSPHIYQPLPLATHRCIGREAARSYKASHTGILAVLRKNEQAS